MLCVLFLTSALVKFQSEKSIPDPDVGTVRYSVILLSKNSAKMIHTFSELEFCSEPWPSSSKPFQLNDAFLLNLGSSQFENSDHVFSRSFRLGILYSYKATTKTKPLFAQMRGSHLGFTGKICLVI